MVILMRVRLDPHHHTSLTKHTLSDSKGKRDFPPFVELVIAAYPGETSCYLFHVCADGQAADTWHQSVEEALDQAEWEFGVQPEEWTVPDEPEPYDSSNILRAH
jgi:hypothetical protein